MKVLVTGSTGFLGQAITNEFKENKIEVIGVSRNSDNYQADLTVEKSLEKLLNLKGIDTVIHAAGLAHQFGKTSRQNFFDVNVRGTENTLKFAKSLGVKHFVLISSVAVYGENSKFNSSVSTFQEETECAPLGYYAQSKFAAEVAAINFCRENNLILTILRPATIIGVGDKGNVMRLIMQIKKKRFFWIGKGNNLKSLVNNKDVAKACYLVFEKGDSESQIYNITAKPLKMSVIVATIADELDLEIPVFYIPEAFAKMAAKFSKTIKKWLSDDVFSGKKMIQKLGFEPKCDIIETIRREVRSLEN